MNKSRNLTLSKKKTRKPFKNNNNLNLELQRKILKAKSKMKTILMMQQARVATTWLTNL